jgi:hypothetical protein
MKNTTYLFVLFNLLSNFAFSQSIDDVFSHKNMRKDLAVFKEIRLKANSGLYKYRTKAQIDSIYKWADDEIVISSTYREFYNIICQLTDFEGSLHNGTRLVTKVNETLQKEKSGYFPYPIKLIGGKWILNIESKEIPLGSEIVSINGIAIENIVKNLYKYYTTDGWNQTGKSVGINYMFSRYYRLHYGRQNSFLVTFKNNKSDLVNQVNVLSIGFIDYYNNFLKRYSKPYDEPVYKEFPMEERYIYETVDSNKTGKLTVNSFNIGENGEAPEHLKFVAFLDSIFIKVKEQNLQNLIVDIRHNGGGTDPNELALYEYLTQRKFSENKSAWVSFQKIPCMKHIDTKVPSFLRFLGVIKYNKYFKNEFPIEKEGRFYQGPLSEDHLIRIPNKNAFFGNIYLLISPEVASAGSNFGSLLASNRNTILIGEETAGGYYGHNGHTPMSYILPKSKIKTSFSIVNLEQYVIEKDSQIFGRGIIPDYDVSQTYEDYLKHEDTQMKFVLELIKTTSE